MRASAVACAFVALTSAGSTTAEAGVFKLFGEVHGGGMMGKGTGGDLVNNNTMMFDEAFFENAGPLAYGLSVGAQFLFLEGHISHVQYRSFSDDAQKPDLATWTAFCAGMRFELPLGARSDQDKKDGKGTFFEVGFNIGFGLGTGAQVSPPLSNDELTDRGFFAEGRVGIGKNLNTIFDIGVFVPVQYGYYFKKGAVNDLSNHYQSAQVSALLTLRANIRLF